MDIEEYAALAPQYYGQQIPPLLEKLLVDGKNKTLLECGCGDGNLLYSLNKRGYLKHMNVIAVDLSQNRIKLVNSIDERFSARVDNVEDLATIENDSIDMLLSTQVIEHVDDRKMLDSIYRVISKNGKVYLTTIYKKWYGWYFYRNKDRWVIDPTHLREYESDDELFQWIDPNRFKILSSEKSLLWFPLIDFFVKRLRVNNRKLFDNLFFSMVRQLKVPIFGYYNWEIILQKI
jgi:2-polyprenyl-3-methyl-5-hydroxy-6-metoxy-1,4-benzoquinol methylase